MHSLNMIMNKPNPNQAPLFFGSIQQTPSDPYPSNYGGADRMVSVEIDEYGLQKIWFKDGGAFDYLQPGDMVLVEYRSNKWRFSKQQTPELITALKARMPAPQIPQTPPAPPAPTAPAPSNVTPLRTDEATARMISIFLELRRALPQVSDEVIAKLACTLFIQSK